MIKEAEKIDTIKLYVQTISKLKKNEEINLTNKLLNTQFNNITNKTIKLMLEIEFLHYEQLSSLEISDIADQVRYYQDLHKVETPDFKIFSLLLLKLQSICITKAIKANNQEEFSKLSSKLVKQITSIDELRYILEILFHVKSLVALQLADCSRIEQKYKKSKEFICLLQIIALVKFPVNPQQSRKIMQKIKPNQDPFKDKKNIIDLINILSKKERQLLKENKNNDKLFVPIDQSTKKVLKNSIQNECKIIINEESQEKTLKNVGTISEEELYLHAFPLAHLYFEKNDKVIDFVRNTELFKYMSTPKSYIVENHFNASYNPSKIHSSKSKTKKHPEKSMAAFEEYLKTSERQNGKTCALVTRKGLMFVKHNYGNLNSSKKFVRLNDEGLQYFKSSVSTDPGNKWKLSEVYGVIYGKRTPRLMQNEDDKPQHCFSFIIQDRTLDLSVESKSEIKLLHTFLRGAVSIINQYHRQAKENIEKQILSIKQDKKGKVEQLKKKSWFHEGKIQKISKGKLLWSQLILSLNDKVLVKVEEKTFHKLQGIKLIAEKISSKPSKKH